MSICLLFVSGFEGNADAVELCEKVVEFDGGGGVAPVPHVADAEGLGGGHCELLREDLDHVLLLRRHAQTRHELYCALSRALLPQFNTFVRIQLPFTHLKIFSYPSVPDSQICIGSRCHQIGALWSFRRD